MQNKRKIYKILFIEKSKDIHKNFYEYSNVNYINNRIKVNIICPKHGMFKQTPKAHTIFKYGCIKCGNDKNV